MFTEDFYRWCFDENVRINWMIPIRAAQDGMQCCDLLEDWAEGLDTKDLQELFHLSKDEAHEASGDSDAVLELLNEGRNDFLVSVETPFRTKGDSSFTWGSTSPATLYVESFDEIVPRIKSWKTRIMRKMNKKSSAK